MERGDAVPDRDWYGVDGRPAHHRSGHPGQQPEYQYEYDGRPVGDRGPERYEERLSPGRTRTIRGSGKALASRGVTALRRVTATPGATGARQATGSRCAKCGQNTNWSDTEWAEPRSAPASRIPSGVRRPQRAPGPGDHPGYQGPRPAAGPGRPQVRPDTRAAEPDTRAVPTARETRRTRAGPDRGEKRRRIPPGNAWARARDARDRAKALRDRARALRDRTGTAAR